MYDISLDIGLHCPWEDSAVSPKAEYEEVKRLYEAIETFGIGLIGQPEIKSETEAAKWESEKEEYKRKMEAAKWKMEAGKARYARVHRASSYGHLLSSVLGSHHPLVGFHYPWEDSTVSPKAEYEEAKRLYQAIEILSPYPRIRFRQKRLFNQARAVALSYGLGLRFIDYWNPRTPIEWFVYEQLIAMPLRLKRSIRELFKRLDIVKNSQIRVLESLLLFMTSKRHNSYILPQVLRLCTRDTNRLDADLAASLV